MDNMRVSAGRDRRLRGPGPAPVKPSMLAIVTFSFRALIGAGGAGGTSAFGDEETSEGTNVREERLIDDSACF